MARDTEKRRAELRETLTDIAEAEIRRQGIGGLRARALAGQAGCAVGAIYNVFTDLTELTLAVNLRTLSRLDDHMAQAVETRGAEPPLERLVAMAEIYIDFASEELNLWRAMFHVDIRADGTAPAWYLDELARVFTRITGPMAELDPGADPAEIELRTKTLFSAVHGVMLLSLERRLSGIPQDQLKRMVVYLLRSTAGKT